MTFACPLRAELQSLDALKGTQRVAQSSLAERRSEWRCHQLRSSTLDFLRRSKQHRFYSFADFGSACCGVLAYFCTGAAARKYLGRIQEPVGIEDLLHPHHRLQV